MGAPIKAIENDSQHPARRSCQREGFRAPKGQTGSDRLPSKDAIIDVDGPYLQHVTTNHTACPIGTSAHVSHHAVRWRSVLNPFKN